MSPARVAKASAVYRGYLLGVLFLVYAFNWADRSLLPVLLELIRLDLHLSDSQMGFLTGIVYALFYATTAILISRWADRGNRAVVIALALGLWSSMTVLFGLAQHYFQLLVARIGVGIGVSGLAPPALSLIASYFDEKRRALAISVFTSGITVGSLAGTIAAGWLAEHYGWRRACVTVGTPGILLAILVWITLREPRRDPAETAEVPPPFTTVARTLWRRAAFRHVIFATSVASFVSYGSEYWIAALMIRRHGLSISEVGTWLGLIWGTAGLAGTLMGGYLADRWGGGDRRWYMWICGYALAIATPLFLLVYLSPTGRSALTVYIFPVFLASTWVAPVFATCQGLAEVHMRATAAALLLATMSFIGLGLGPQTVGLVSDLLSGWLGLDSLRWALVVCAPVNLWAVTHFFLAARTLRADLSSVQD